MATSEELSAQIYDTADRVNKLTAMFKAFVATEAADDKDKKAKLAELAANLDDVAHETMFDQTVARGLKDIPVIQEIADIKTMLLEARDKGKL